MSIPKKVLSTFLAIVLLMFVFPTNSLAVENSAGMSNFIKTKTYVNGQYYDVQTSAWFATDVATAYELGLMGGTSSSFFHPFDNVSIAEAITMASRIYSIYTTGTENFVQGSPWYQAYVDYALENGVIKSGYSDYNKAATRAEFAIILSGSLPDEALPAINTVNDGSIPDVQLDVPSAPAIYRLYRAGILTGNDSFGTFTPNSNIGRNAAAAIVTRMADTNLRKSITFTVPVPTTAISLNKTALSLGIGFSATLTANFIPGDTTGMIINWTSSNTKVAIVSAAGKVTGIALGTAVITAKFGNDKTATCNVTVAKLGTITNPLPVNNNTTVEFQEYTQDSIRRVIVSVEAAYTGEAAYSIVQSENVSNTAPTSTREWRLYIFNITYISGKNDADVLNVCNIISPYSLYTNPGSKIPVHSSFLLGDQYGAYDPQIIKLYPGTSSKVVIGFLTDKNVGDAILRVPYNGGASITWISCTP